MVHGPKLDRHIHLAQERVSLVRDLGIRHSIRRWRTDRIAIRLLQARLEGFTRTIWAEAATTLGVAFSEPSPRLFEFAGDGVVVHVLGQRTPFADPVSIELASAKDLAYEVLARFGVPVPQHIAIERDDRRSAVAFLEAGPSPVVVKPARAGGAGRGVTPSITTTKQLERAMRYAGLTSRRLSVERQATGEHYRLLLLDGELLDVLHRRRPVVVGDGTSTIEQLMFAEYDRRLASPGVEGLKPFPVDLDCLFTLEIQDLHLSTVLPRGRAAIVKSATNISGGKSCYTVTEPVHPALLRQVRTACVALGVRFAGVDVIASDITQSLASTGGVVLEVNPIPGLHHHYNVANPSAATRVAIPILEALFAQRRAAYDSA